MHATVYEYMKTSSVFLTSGQFLTQYAALRKNTYMYVCLCIYTFRMFFPWLTIWDHCHGIQIQFFTSQSFYRYAGPNDKEALGILQGGFEIIRF